MVSAIDPTVPVFGSPTTASVRSNFLIAKNEITALQAVAGITFPITIAQGGTGATTAAAALTSLGAVPLAGGTMTGLLLLSGNPTNNLGAATKQYVDGMFPVSVSNGGTGANNSTSALANLGGAPTASPTFTGIPQAPTAPTGDSSTIIATTAFVHNVISAMPAPITSVVAGTGITANTAAGVTTVGLTIPVSVANGGTGAGTATGALSNLGGAPLASPVFTGVPAAPTPPPGTNTTQLATTAFVLTAIGAGAGVSTVTASSGGGLLVNGLVATPASGAVAIALSVPVSIANGGTGATNGNSAYDSLLGGISSGSGFITRQTGGAYALTPATLTPANRSMIINASNAISTSAIMTDNGTTVNVLPAGNLQVGTFVAGAAASTLIVNTNTTAPPATSYVPNPQIWVVASDSNHAAIQADAWGTSSSFLIGRKARGTAAAPAALQGGDVMLLLASLGRGATGFFNNAAISMAATEAWSDTNRGASVNIATTPNGSATTVTSLVLAGNTARLSGGAVIGTGNAPATPDPGPGALTLNANTVAPPAGVTANLYVVGADAANTTIETDSFGAGAGSFIARKSRGTAAAPTAVQNTDYLAQFGARGYGASAYGGNTSGLAVQASENWTGTVQGTLLSLQTTLNGTTTPVNSLILQGNTATFSGNAFVNGGLVNLGGAGIAQSSMAMNTTAQAWSLTTDSASRTCWIYDNSGGNFRFEIIQATGATLNTSGTWGTISDTRAKENIQPYDVGLQAILALDPIRYDLALDEVKGEGLVGFAAEQVAQVMPELCGTTTKKLDGEEIEFLTTHPTGVVFALVNAVKELKAEIEALKTHVGA